MPKIIANDKDDLNVVSQMSCLAGHFAYKAEKSTYFRQGNVPISDWEKYLYQTGKGTNIRQKKVAISE